MEGFEERQQKAGEGDTEMSVCSMVAKTEVQWPGKGGINGPEVNMRTKSPLSSYEEVKNIWRKESDVSKWRSEFEMEEKGKVQRIKFGMLVEGLKRWSD